MHISKVVFFSITLSLFSNWSMSDNYNSSENNSNNSVNQDNKNAKPEQKKLSNELNNSTINNENTHNLLIEISGLKIVSERDVKKILKFSSPDKINSHDSISNLIKSGYFSDVKIIQIGKKVKIELKENHILHKIEFNGVSRKLVAAICSESNIKLPKEGEFVNTRDLEFLVEKVIDSIRTDGYLNAKSNINYKIDKKTKNLIVTINIIENSKLRVSEVTFIGTSIEKKLKQIVSVKKTKWYSYFSTNRIDEKSLEKDCISIESFYQSIGYFDAKVVDCKAILSCNKKNLFVNFYISEGDRYNLGNIDIVVQNKKIEKLCSKIISQYKKQKYSHKILNKIIEEISKVIKSSKIIDNFDINHEISLDSNNKIVKVLIKIEDEPTYHVSAIQISGNKNIPTKKIRKLIKISEGNRYFKIDTEEITRQIFSYEFFEDVKVKIVEEDEEYNNKKIKSVKIKIDVKEKLPFPRMSIFGGYHQIEGLFIEGGLGIKKHYIRSDFLIKFSSQYKNIQIVIDNNSLPKEISYQLKLFLTRDRKQGQKKENESDISEGKESKNNDKSLSTVLKTPIDGFCRDTVGMQIGISLPLFFSNFYMGPNFGISYEKIKANENVSKMLRKQSGRYLLFDIGTTMYLDNLDNIRMPKDGFYISLLNSLIFIKKIEGEFDASNLIKSILTCKLYKSIDKKKLVTFYTVFQLGMIRSIGKNNNFRVVDKFFPYDTLVKGFDSPDCIGPKNKYGKNYESVGGTNFSVLSFNLVLPFNKKLTSMGMNWVLFIDNASISSSGIFDRESKISQDSFYVNTSIGIGIFLRTSVIGDIFIYGSYPIRYQANDRKVYFGITVN
jgi:outer membrane protein insertion porin family